MNSLSNVKRKIMQFSLTPASQRILNEFAAKYGTNKSIVIDRALEMLAAKYHITISIHYEINENNNYNEIMNKELPNFDDEKIKKMIKIAKTNIYE